MNISVIIPVYNDPDGLANTLDSLVLQTYSADKYETIVVDNNSSDSTPEVISKFEEEHPKIVKFKEERELQGSYAARNTGIEEASGEILVFIDSDMIASPDLLESIDNAFYEGEFDYIGCNVRVKIPDEEGSILASYNKARAFPIEFYLNKHNFSPTCGLAVKKSVVEDVGYFDERLISGGDSEFGKRVADAGYNQGFAQDAKLTHPARTTYSEIISKGVRLGRGRAQLRAYNGKRSISISDFLPPHPMKYKERIGREYSLLQFTLFYIFEIFMKAFKLRGILSERSSLQAKNK